jgi:hypothetical protein
MFLLVLAYTASTVLATLHDAAIAGKHGPVAACFTSSDPHIAYGHVVVLAGSAAV